jgi:predicted dehydrogenase/threonine dehydrogenase-like Zn-dependent dehydrogenase
LKQLLQRLDSGLTTVVDAPAPAAGATTIVVQNVASVVSAGTERMLVEFGRSNFIEKARQQPDKVRQVLDKMRTDGIATTLDAVRSKLETPIALGYCSAGVVVEVGSKVQSFAIGDRVVTNGSHAEFVKVPHTLAARIPDNVSFEAAAFTPVAAIGLQGIRLAEPTLGETVVVIGLGLIGLLTVQLLYANGCRVIGIDPDPTRRSLAERFGARALAPALDIDEQVIALTAGRGADAVLLTLASSSDEPVKQAARMSRKRGRIVLVGVTGLTLSRDDFYRKELSFAVSCSYGPGRYDPLYEEAGQDYPLGFVRWTEQRNFDAVLDLMAAGKIDPLPLITHRYAFAEAPAAYEVVSGSEPSLGIVLNYPDAASNPIAASRTIQIASPKAQGEAISIGVIGAGNFAVRTLLPLFSTHRVRLRTIASGSGTSAVAAQKFGFETATSAIDEVIDDPAINTVFILTRHDSHARLAIRALNAGKHVFIEKPLALSHAELDEVVAAARASDRLLMVGFNRRFAPLTHQVQDHIRGRSGPAAIVAVVNSGKIPRDHWTQDPATGGGRIVGEACHWIDLCRAIVGAPIANVTAIPARDSVAAPVDDIASIGLEFGDGSIANVHYLANGARAFPKERLDIFFDGKTLTIDNWRRLLRYGVQRPLIQRNKRMDKGHAAELTAWFDAIRNGGASPIPLGELAEISRISIEAAGQARSRARSTIMHESE